MLESKKTKCSECYYCKMHGRADTRYAGIGRSGYGRGNFFCEHPGAQNLKDNRGLPKTAFIGYGTAESTTRLQLKTMPRWCPLTDME